MADPKHLETVLDHVPSALFLLDVDRVILTRNRAASDLIPQLEVGMNIWEAMGGFTNEEKIDRIMRGERIVLAVGPDQPVLEWMIADERPEDGSLVLMVWEAAITDKVIQGRITFIMGASHELRSPLTALLGFAEILELESGTLTTTQAEAVKVILQNAEHLNSMVDDVIDLSRNNFGELKLDLEMLDVGEATRGVCETLRPQIEEKGQFLHVSADRPLEPIEADLHRIRQIVFNLVQNANKHNPPGTAIVVTTEQVEDGILLTVRDDGNGLAFEEPEEAFRSFRRGPHDNETEIAGSGIGLTITKQVVELHRGVIEIETAPGNGTSFEVWLPSDRKQARNLIRPNPIQPL